MLLFLNNILKKVDEMNIEFQTESFRMHKLYKAICSMYRNIMATFIKDGILVSEKLSTIDPTDSKNYKDLKDIDLGGRCEAALMTECLGKNESRFRSDCLKFCLGTFLSDTQKVSCRRRQRHCFVAVYGSTGINKS